jgi:hypothetical protein
MKAQLRSPTLETGQTVRRVAVQVDARGETMS